MGKLSRCLAKDFGLTLRTTDDVDELVRHLNGDGIGIINVGGDRPGHKGVFSDGGHYVVAFGVAPDGRLVLADPYLYAGKYDKPHRKVVEVVGDLLYAAPVVADEDARNRSPRYTLLGV